MELLEPGRAGDGEQVQPTTVPAARFPVIALVASTGGLDALGRVLAPLPAGFPAAVIALMHLDPAHVSYLPGLLARKTALPVWVAEDGSLLRPGTVVVVPPGRHLLVGSGERLALIASGQSPPSRPSADLLLVSMAVSLGERVIGVVLSGAGHDGTTGAVAVKRFGGRVLAQDELSSAAFGMPAAAIDTNLVDQVLPVGHIARALLALVGSESHYLGPGSR